MALSDSSSSPCLSPATTVNTQEKIESVQQDETKMGVVESEANTCETALPPTIAVELPEPQIGSNEELL